jgi:polysaccharide export outer membrane protein
MNLTGRASRRHARLPKTHDHFAKPEHAKIMRPVPNSEVRQEIPLDLKQILAGKTTDVSLHADDILFIPNSPKKAAAARTIEAAIQIGGMAIYRIP